MTTIKQLASQARNNGTATSRAQSAFDHAERIIAERIQTLKGLLVRAAELDESAGNKAATNAVRDAWGEGYQTARRCSNDARRKAWSRYRGAALSGQSGTQSPADRKAKAKAAQGSEATPKGGANGAQTSAPAHKSAETSGEVIDIELARGIASQAATLRVEVEAGNMPTPRQLAAFCADIITRCEIATGSQLVN